MILNGQVSEMDQYRNSCALILKKKKKEEICSTQQLLFPSPGLEWCGVKALLVVTSYLL